jgi:DNA-directed RNA polymerase specialized sigma subunit
MQNKVKELINKSRRQVEIPVKANRRDKMILQAYQYGASPSIIGLEFGISRARVHQIITKYQKV